MPRAVLDTSMLYAAAYRRDAKHDDALPILRGVDDGTLPEGVVLEFVLAETLNGLTVNAGQEAAVDFLDRIETNPRFHVASLTGDALARGKDQFREHASFSFVDACIVAHMQTEGLGYLYAFDDDFDRAEDVYRLDTATDPYGP